MAKSKPSVEIGKRLKRIRLSSSLTQAEMARILGVTAQQVQKYETARNRLNVEVVQKISKHFRISYNYILDGEEEDNWLISQRERVRKIKNLKVKNALNILIYEMEKQSLVDF